MTDGAEEQKRITRATVPWPHAPLHELGEQGVYIVTAGTYEKLKLFTDGPRLRMLHDALLTIAADYDWRLEAWAVFPNHYHFVAQSPADPECLSAFLGELHTRTAAALNRHDGVEGRSVWHNFWDTRVTYQRSYFARLNYVHQNPVRHGLVAVANQYPYCSAAWFERTATPAQVHTIYSLRIDRVNVYDDF